MFPRAMLPLCLLSLGVSALPAVEPRDTAGVISLPFSKTYSARTVGSSRRRAITAPLANEVVSYLINVTIGTPPQPLSLVLDTGSSDIWVYSPESESSCSTCTDTYYNPSSSSTGSRLNNLGVFNISYGTPNSGVTGYYAADQVAVSGTSVLQTIGVATVAHSGDPPGGIFGVGLSQGESIVRNGVQPYSGYVDTLAKAGVISSRSYSIFLDGTSATDASDGTIIFGGTDSSKYTGSLVAFPLIEPAPDGVYRLDIADPATSITIGDQSADLSPASSAYTVLLDTGTTLTYLPADEFESIAYAVGAVSVDDGQVYVVDCALADQPGSLDFAFSGASGSVTIAVPWTQLVIEDASLPAGYCVLGLLPEADADELGFYILGDTFLRSAYLLYDFDNGSISLAQASG